MEIPQMNKILDTLIFRQFVSYLFVGGSAAIVEWILFSVFSNVLNIDYIVATCIAFLFSTTVNWLLGKLWTFKEIKTYENQKGKELLLVFGASTFGLLFNIGLMYLFVATMQLNTPLSKTVSKIMATGIVFIWNFIIRKYVIYKQYGDGGMVG